MKLEQRLDNIIKLLTKSGRASVEELSAELGVTPQTIRRDLGTLAEDNRVVRFHGGASLLAGIEYTGYEARQNIAEAQKARIGEACAKLIPDNVAVMINSGTTTSSVARALVNHKGLRVVTDSVKISDEIKDFSGLDLLVPGGRVRPSDGSIVGHQAVEFISQFRPDFAIFGVAAISHDGTLLDYDIAEVSVVRAMMRYARNIILCADSSKFQKMAPIRVADLADINVLVTDTSSSEVLRQLCQNQKVRVIEA